MQYSFPLVSRRVSNFQGFFCSKYWTKLLCALKMVSIKIKSHCAEQLMLRGTYRINVAPRQKGGFESRPRLVLLYLLSVQSAMTLHFFMARFVWNKVRSCHAIGTYDHFFCIIIKCKNILQHHYYASNRPICKLKYKCILSPN